MPFPNPLSNYIFSVGAYFSQWPAQWLGRTHITCSPTAGLVAKYGRRTVRAALTPALA